MDTQKLQVPARSVFAAILLNAADSGKGPEWPTIVDLSNQILELRNECRLDIDEMPIRADRNGWISDDFSSFVNRFVLFGLADQNPVRLSPKALKLCKEIIQEDSKEYQEQIRVIVQALEAHDGR